MRKPDRITGPVQLEHLLDRTSGRRVERRVKKARIDDIALRRVSGRQCCRCARGCVNTPPRVGDRSRSAPRSVLFPHDDVCSSYAGMVKFELEKGLQSQKYLGNFRLTASQQRSRQSILNRRS